ncbi:MAG: hypothetical protein AB3N17_17710 [Tateyamaria sp.]
MIFEKSFDIDVNDQDLGTLEFDIVPLDNLDLSVTDSFDFTTIDTSGLDSIDLDAVTFVTAPTMTGSGGFSSVSVSAFAAVGPDGSTASSLSVDTFGNATADVSITVLGDTDFFSFG